jgi:hypothetical protein
MDPVIQDKPPVTAAEKNDYGRKCVCVAMWIPHGHVSKEMIQTYASSGTDQHVLEGMLAEASQLCDDLQGSNKEKAERVLRPIIQTIERRLLVEYMLDTTYRWVAALRDKIPV